MNRNNTKTRLTRRDVLKLIGSAAVSAALALVAGRVRSAMGPRASTGYGAGRYGIGKYGRTADRHTIHIPVMSR